MSCAVPTVSSQLVSAFDWLPNTVCVCLLVFASWVFVVWHSIKFIWQRSTNSRFPCKLKSLLLTNLQTMSGTGWRQPYAYPLSIVSGDCHSNQCNDHLHLNDVANWNILIIRLHLLVSIGWMASWNVDWLHKMWISMLLVMLLAILVLLHASASWNSSEYYY